MALRTDARLSLDDITEVMQRCFEPRLSRSAIRRCLVRHGIGGPLPKDAPPEPGGRFDPVPFGYVHVDLKYLGKLRSRAEYAFVAIERVSRFAHVEVLPDREAATVAAAMARFLAAFGHPVHTVLTDNGAEFTDRFKDGSKAGHAARPTGAHPFDKVCATAGIIHRTTRPYRPETNGMAERFNRRLSEAMHALPPLRDNSRHRTRFASHPSARPSSFASWQTTTAPACDASATERLSTSSTITRKTTLRGADAARSVTRLIGRVGGAGARNAGRWDEGSAGGRTRQKFACEAAPPETRTPGVSPARQRWRPAGRPT